MLDNLFGLILLGLGINTGPFNPNVMGDETVATEEAETEVEVVASDDANTAGTLPGAGLREPPRPIKNTFRLNAEKYRLPATGSGNKIKNRIRLDARAFGKNVLRIQENFREQLEASREAAKEEFEQRREEFKQELQLIREEKKREVVERINEHCQEVNTKRTEKMEEMLEKLSSILTNVSNKTDEAAADGKDTTAVEEAITDAQTAISDAQSMVAAQAAATCDITITDEETLKANVGEAISAHREAMRLVFEKVVDARKAVKDAVRLLAQLMGEKLAPTPTPTP